MKKLASPESASFPGDNSSSAPKCWLDDDSCILDIDYFVKTLTGIKAKGVRPDLIGSIITHYASKWLPELSGESLTKVESSPESATASWLKKRFFLETLVAILPPERDSIPCNFLLRLLKNANMGGVDSGYREELEKRVSWQLDQASLKELMIPCFSHSGGTLFDVELVLRLVKRFVDLDESVRSGAAMVKVAKLVDSYLAEAAVDSNLTLPEFMELAGAIPAEARATDDGLYRAIDTYLKAHPDVSKKERKSLCKLIDCQKLSLEASLHAAQNERLPVRAVIQVLFSEQAKLNCHIDWSRSFSSTRTPNLGLDSHDRCHSSRDMTARQMEIKTLKEDVSRLQRQCCLMQAQIDKLLEKKKKFFSWKKLGVASFKAMSSVAVANDQEREGKSDLGYGRQTPIDNGSKGKMAVRGKTQAKWRRKSVS